MCNMFNKIQKIKEEERKKIIIEIQNDFSNKLISYHSNYLQKQEQLKKVFEYKKIDVININICDDFYDDGFAPNGEEQNTYAYVDTLNIPDIETKKILEILLEYITNNSLLPESVKIELNFYDSTTQYPFLVLEYEYHLYKRWQIEFKNITHKILDKLIYDLQKIELSLKEVKFDIYSES